MSNRPYQSEGMKQISAAFARGVRKVLLVLSTGGGKTHMFSEAIVKTVSRGNPAVMVVRGKHLVEQAHLRLQREKVEHGVLQGDHWNKNSRALAQICSIDTLIRRELYPPAKLLVIDEAHLFVSDGCRDYIAEFLRRNPDAYILAVTATPYGRDSLRHLAEEIVSPITTRQLINQGYLVEPKYALPDRPDLTGVRIVRGEYDEAQVEERMDLLTGDMPRHWSDLSSTRPTLGFGVNIRHSQSLTAAFNRAGIPSEHVEGMTTMQEREAAIGRLKRGDTKVLFNVGVLCTGVDIPAVSSILMARPTKSYNLYIQICGRGTRPHPESGKKDFLILDHAGNVLRHGLIDDQPEVDLDGRPRGEKGVRAFQCEECYAIFTGMECHACGWRRAPVSKKERELEIDEGTLKIINELPESAKIAIFIRRQKEVALRKGYKRGWIYHRLKEAFGEEVANQVYPTHAIPWQVRAWKPRTS